MSKHEQVAYPPNRETIQKPKSPPFAFVGDSLALDFVNTEMVIRRRGIDLLAPSGAYESWWSEASAHYPDLARLLPPTAIVANPDLLPDAIALRGALRAIFSAVAGKAPLPPDEMSALNRALSNTHDAVAGVGSEEPQFVLVPRGRDMDGTMAAVARSAASLLTAADPARLHRCANGHCVLLFFDTTKSGTRRWCSTACMNRARSTQRYLARKSQAQEQGTTEITARTTEGASPS